MTVPIISVENLAKRYLVGHRADRPGQVHLREQFNRGLRNTTRKAGDLMRGRQIVQGDEIEEFWALKDVSFAVQQGEVLGIVGRNGAGKSTLLKILSRITEPTHGRVTLRGRVASLLEVGTGFHPELSGRENIYLNGAILGMGRTEIRKKFDEIVAFAEVEKFLDTPVKRYSSGMYVRLAFAVAAYLEPEILVVDEVLAVGDIEFQKKCLGKMDEVSRREGRTIIFVSHDMGAVQRLCSKAMILERGCIVAISEDVPSTLESYSAARRDLVTSEWINDGKLYDKEYLVPSSLRVYPAVKKSARGSTSARSDFVVEIEADIVRADPTLSIGIVVYLAGGEQLFISTIHDAHSDGLRELPTGRAKFRVKLPSDLLNDGEFEVELIAMHHNRRYLIAPGVGPRVRFTNSFSYLSPYWDRKRPGIIAPKLLWDCEVAGASDAVARTAS